MTIPVSRDTAVEEVYELASGVASGARHLIGGEVVDGTVAATVRAPWNRQLAVDYRIVDSATVRDAVAAARRAFDEGTGDHGRRRDVLLAMANSARSIQDELAVIIAFETGKLMRSATMEAAGVAASLEYWATVQPRTEALSSDDAHTTELVRKPLGVVAAITPFNMPVLMMANKVGAALSTGNTVVCKPSPAAPLAALRLAGAVADVVPAGWVNIVAGDDDAGPVLSSSPDVAMVSFTGSAAVGKSIMQAAAGTLKRLQLELGGNDAAIIGPDADLATAIPEIFRSAFGSSGQACVAAKRVYAHQSVADDVAERLARLAEETRVGHPFDDQATAPVLTTEAQYDKVEELLEGVRGKSKILFEGRRSKTTGFYMQPSIVTGISNGSPLVDEEQFGPVLPVVCYSSTAEAIELANATTYGLGATVWSEDEAFIAEVVPRLETGMVWVNGLGMPHPSVPFGGVKESGVGREGGEAGVDAFTELVTVTQYRPAPGKVT
ncbi:aldehyde dehydrogenase family protein [Georgenia halophila]|uniref:Aldehyde dehydrogenase family protein n=1 Tax=Georgenia halophila TaxID=620889 RepID=A0ABP8LJH4_9MICO